jgi:hypothetical protein
MRQIVLPTSVLGGKYSNDQNTSCFAILHSINSTQDLFSVLFKQELDEVGVALEDFEASLLGVIDSIESATNEKHVESHEATDSQ